MWLSITVNGRLHCWDLAAPNDATLQDQIARARLAVDFPPGDEWMRSGDPSRRVQIADGQPHPHTLAQAQVHAVDELRAVTADQVTAYVADCDHDRQAARLADAQAVVDALPDADKATLRTRLGWTAVELKLTGRS